MSKRIIITGIILILASSIVIGFIYIRKSSSLTANPWKVIPVDAAFILRINDYQSFEKSLSEDSKIWRSLSLISPFKNINSNLHFLDSIADLNMPFSDLLMKSKMLISGHYIGGRKSNYLLVLSLPSAQGEKNIIDLISEISGQDLGNKQRKYEGKTIYSFQTSTKASENSYYLSVFEGNFDSH